MIDVSIRKIGYVDVIAHAGSICSRMIIAEYVVRLRELPFGRCAPNQIAGCMSPT
jgi:hypothetical protein